MTKKKKNKQYMWLYRSLSVRVIQDLDIDFQSKYENVSRKKNKSGGRDLLLWWLRKGPADSNFLSWANHSAPKITVTD